MPSYFRNLNYGGSYSKSNHEIPLNFLMHEAIIYYVEVYCSNPNTHRTSVEGNKVFKE